MKIVLSGYHGAMGKIIRDMVDQTHDTNIVAGIDQTESVAPIPVVSEPFNLSQEGDVVIDFSHPSAVSALIQYGLKTKTPLVICTTGLDDSILSALKAASKEIPVFHSGNMSFGVYILQDMLNTYSKLLHPLYDIEIIEKHHRRKVDAPSGTALMLAESINASLGETLALQNGRHGKAAKRGPNEIGIHAIRGGTIVGEHEVIFAGEDEIIRLSHTAMSRRLFASGALKAASFLIQMKPGYYSMSDVIQYFK